MSVYTLWRKPVLYQHLLSETTVSGPYNVIDYRASEVVTTAVELVILPMRLFGFCPLPAYVIFYFPL